jgi:HSP20 family protein
MLALNLINEVDRINQEINQLFQQGEENKAFSPAINVRATKDEIQVAVDLPGIDATKLDLALDGNVLRIRGERPVSELKEGETWLAQEGDYGAFERALRLPFHAEASRIEANYTQGVLTIKLPRAESEKAKKIEVKVS